MNKVKSLPIVSSLIPLIMLILLLAYNVFVFGDDALSGSNQFILLIGASIAATVGFYYKVSYKKMLVKVADNFQSVAGAILILLLGIPL